MNPIKRLLPVLAFGFFPSFGLFPSYAYSAEMVGIFADPDITSTPIAGDIVGPLRFAAEDVKKSLVSQKYDVEILPISSLTITYPHKKIVLALANNATARKVLEGQGGTTPTALGEQAYELLTTSNGRTSYWVLGGDERGAMYGGLQLAENIHFEGFTREQRGRVSPSILARGAKLNMAFDRRIPTYAGKNGTKTPSIARGIEQAWSMDFWKDWIDQQARNRYNLLSVWNHSPFAVLVNVPGFEKSTIDYIQGMKGIAGVSYFEDKSLTLAKRQQFWKDVMKYGKKRGFDFYFFNWNVCMEHVEDFYPVKGGDINNATNKEYLNNAIYELLKTYPDLAGFGVSPGDAMPNVAAADIAKWVFDAYASGVSKFARENRGRKVTFIHRNLKVKATDVVGFWQKCMQENPNLRFDHSLKYCMAYTYSTVTPAWAKSDKRDMVDMGQTTFLTLRNDGFFYTDFGDSGFVREFIASLPPAKHIEGSHKGKDYLRGFYLGHDTYTPTRSYLFKDPELNNNPETGKPMLEIERKWLMEMLWGRIGYDKNVSDEVFARGLAMRYPSLPSASYQTLFQAWAKASQVNTKLMELVQGEWKLDSHFHTEFCMYKNDGEHYFRTLEHFWKGVWDSDRKKWRYPTPANGSENILASIKETGEGNKDKKPNDSWKVATLLEKNGNEALGMLAGIPTGGNKRVDALIKSIRTQGLLSLYYAHYVRAATYLAMSPQEKTNAKNEMYKAYGWWMRYVNTMESLYIAEDFRTYEIKALGWHFWDKAVLKEYANLGGIGTPELPKLPTASAARKERAGQDAHRR